jgi:p-aminobenzoyl-glutamate transporter AbgT
VLVRSPNVALSDRLDKKGALVPWWRWCAMVTLLIVLGFFVLLAILGPMFGADSRVPGGWTPIEPGGKLWPGPR